MPEGEQATGRVRLSEIDAGRELVLGKIFLTTPHPFIQWLLNAEGFSGLAG